MLHINDELVIRPATNHDCAKIRQLVFGVLAEFGLSPDPANTDADLDDVESSYLTRGGMFEVIEKHGREILGSVGIYPLDGRNCELRKMYLAPELRGYGHGKLLLERALSFARNHGFASVMLETSSVLHDAIALYERYGFRPITSDHLASRADQAYVLELEK